MKKNVKFVKFALFCVVSLFMASSVLTGCKDYDDDINNLQEQIDANKAAIKNIQDAIDKGYLLTKVESDGDGGINVTLSDGKTYQIKKGNDGAKGDKGDKGDQGIQGIQGPKGTDGTNGETPVFSINEDGELVATWADKTTTNCGKVVAEAPEVKFEINEDGELVYNGTSLGNVLGAAGPKGEPGKDAPSITFERRDDNLFAIIGEGEDKEEIDLGNIKGETPALPEISFSFDPETGDLAVKVGEDVTTLGQIAGVMSLEDGVFYYTIDGNKTEVGKVSFKDVNLNVQDDYLYVGDSKVEPAIKMNQNILAQEKDGYYEISLPGADGEYVSIILPTQSIFSERLTSLAFMPDYYADGVQAIVFRSLFYDELGSKESDVVVCKDYDNDYKYFTAATATAKYHLNPTTVDLNNATYTFVANRAYYNYYTRNGSGVTPPIAILSQSKEGNTATFVVKKTEKFSDWRSEKFDIVALKATLTKGLTEEEVTNETVVNVFSEYARVVDRYIHPCDLFIADKKALTTGIDAHYANTFNDAKAKTWYQMAYDKDFNLGALIATCLWEDGHSDFNIEDFGLHYEFSMPTSKYEITEGATVTDQQKYIVCKDAEKGIFNVVGYNKESIGRTPIVRVDLKDEKDRTIIRAFVKLEIIAEKAGNILIPQPEGTLVFKCGTTPATYTINEEYIREDVYRKLNISHEEFWNIYRSYSTYVEKNGVKFVMPTPKIIDGRTEAGVATKKIVWEFKHNDLGPITNKGAGYDAILILKNNLTSSEYPEEVKFHFTLSVVQPKATLVAQENEIYWENEMFKVNVAVPETTASPSRDCRFNTALSTAWVDEISVEGLNNCYTWAYRLKAVKANGISAPELLAGEYPGVYIDEDDNIRLRKNNDAVKAALNSDGGLQATIEIYATLDNGDEISLRDFTVNFIRPVNLNGPSDLFVTDAQDDGDEVTFGWDGLLTDWRGFDIIPPTWTMVEREFEFGYWKLDCPAGWIPEQTIVTPGHHEITLKEVTLPAGETTVYYATVTYFEEVSVRNWAGLGWGRWSSPVVTPRTTEEVGPFESLAEAEATALELVPEDRTETFNYGISQRRYEYTDPSAEVRTETTPGEITIKVIDQITWIEATTETIPGHYDSHEHSRKPWWNGHTYGQKQDCWVWTKGIRLVDVPDRIPGQYWNFYGEFGRNPKLDMGNVKTSLDYNGNKLPVSVTLEQVNNYTVKYVNTGAPIGYEYKIYIPMTMDYGWGTVESTLTITVKPVI